MDMVFSHLCPVTSGDAYPQTGNQLSRSYHPISPCPDHGWYEGRRNIPSSGKTRLRRLSPDGVSVVLANNLNFIVVI
jgi:hypothetical protein